MVVAVGKGKFVDSHISLQNKEKTMVIKRSWRKFHIVDWIGCMGMVEKYSVILSDELMVIV